MAFALPREEFQKLCDQLEQLEQTPDDPHLRAGCLKRTHAICDALANGAAIEAQLVKLVEAGNAGRAAKLVAVFADGGALMRRLKLGRMF